MIEVIEPAPQPRPPTKPGTPCDVCGKPLTKALLKVYPYADTCNRPCFMTKVIRSMQPWQLAAERPGPGAEELRVGRAGTSRP